jgi:anti-sigma factor RsiW
MNERPVHPESSLVPYLRNELAPEERRHVAAHLDDCLVCRGALADARAVLERLASAPAPPAPHWGRYRAELRSRLARGRPSPWRMRPASIAVSAGLAAALLLLTVRPAPVPPRANVDPVEETIIGARLPLIENYDFVERLDLLENLDIIRDLDRPVRDG